MKVYVEYWLGLRNDTSFLIRDIPIRVKLNIGYLGNTKEENFHILLPVDMAHILKFDKVRYETSYQG